MLNNIQALRAVAAFMVVFFHASDLVAGRAVHAFEWGSAGVDIFFVISGFIMVHTTRPGTTPGQFAANRILRIVPLYWGVTLAVFVAAMAVPSLMGSTRADLGQLAKSLLFIPYLKESGLVQPLLFVGWTLNLEMMFYAIFAASLLAGRRAPLVASTVLLAMVALHPWTTGDPVLAFVTQPILLEFGAGMLLAHSGRVAGPRTALLLIALGFALLVLHPVFWPGIGQASARAIPALMIVAGAVSLERHGHAIRHRGVLYLGDASYAIYLVHAFVTTAAVKLFVHSAVEMRMVGLALALLASAAIGAAVHQAFVPVTRLLKGRRRRTSHAPVARGDPEVV